MPVEGCTNPVGQGGLLCQSSINTCRTMARPVAHCITCVFTTRTVRMGITLPLAFAFDTTGPSGGKGISFGKLQKVATKDY